MKTSLFVAGFASTVLLSTFLLFAADAGSVQNPRSRQSADVRKISDTVAGEIDVDVNVAFSGESGVTITDENGTYYCCSGWWFFEPKVYPPEYWGVFPLYFFGDVVGVTLSVENQSPDDVAEVRVRRECYCLRTDGSNGGAITTPVQDDLSINAAETVVVDSSFIAQYWTDSEEGLDRFLTMVHRPTSVDANNGAHNVGGLININPNNSAQNEFILRIPGGAVITRDDLTESHTGYSGQASSIHVKPKGNGNQNGMIVDGQAYRILNANTYDIISDSMQVELYNDHVNSDGKAMGRWWLSIGAASSTILVDEASNPPLKVHEAVFCPPEYNAAVVETVRSALGR